jgi:hypothetical protein
MDLKELEESAAANRKVLEKACESLADFLNGASAFTKGSTGVSAVKRGGEARNVHYVELADDSGPTLRIEVYTK